MDLASISICRILVSFKVSEKVVNILFRKQDNSGESSVRRLLQKKYEQLGPIRYEEKCILFMFLTLVLLWFFRHPNFIKGWGDFFPKDYVTDGTAAMMMALLMFVIPAQNPFHNYNNEAAYRPLMTWKMMKDKFAWGTLLLLGGGYAMGEGVEVSGLSALIGRKMSSLESLPNWIFIAIACLLVIFVSEFSSNVATAAMFLPMVESMVSFVKLTLLQHRKNYLATNNFCSAKFVLKFKK